MTFPRSIKNAGTLISGNLVAQGIAFASYLLLSRLFTPDDFGLYNIFYSYLEVLIILSTCKYELSIVVAHNDASAVRIARMTLRLNTLISLFLLTVSLVLMFSVPNSLPIPPVLILAIPLMVFLCGTSRVYCLLGIRTEKFLHNATGEIITSLGGTLSKIAAGLLTPMLPLLHTIGLPLGTLLGRGLGNLYLRRHSAALLQSHRFHPTRPQRLALARHYRRYPLFVMPKELLSSLSANLPFLWLSIWFDNATIGLFALALTFTQRPVIMLANAFEASFFSDSSQRMRSQQPLFPQLKRFIILLSAIALMVCLPIFFYAEPLFSWLFGNQWIGTGFYVRCLLPWLIIRLLANSLSFVSNLFETQRTDFLLQVLLFLLRVVGLYIGIRLNDFHLAVLLFATTSATVQIIQLCWYLIQLYRHDKQRPLHD